MTLNNRSSGATWEHFQHGSDIGIRGIGPSKQQAFEQAALALTAVVAPLERVRSVTAIEIRCDSTDDEFLFLDWINAVIYEMATRSMLFSRFQISLDEAALSATAWGEAVDVARHCPAVEPKGATFTELAVKQVHDGIWIAQCVVDV